MEERETSTTSTVVPTVMRTQCDGGDGSSTVLGSAAQVSRDPNTSSVVPVTGGTHVVYGCDTVTVSRQKTHHIKKESVSTDTMNKMLVMSHPSTLEKSWTR